MRSDKSEKRTKTYFEIGIDKYVIRKEQQVMESGNLEIDARHQKIIFTKEETVCNAWFFSRELRLTNSIRVIQYCLRR